MTISKIRSRISFGGIEEIESGKLDAQRDMRLAQGGRCYGEAHRR